MAVTSYTGIEGVIREDGTIRAFVKFNLDIKRNVASAKRGAAWSALNRPGTVEVTGSITEIVIDGNLYSKLISKTPSTGAAETLKAGLSVAADGYTAMTDTVIAAPSLVRLTVATAAMTTPGTVTLIGEDASGQPREETLAVGLLGIGECVTSKTAFKEVFGAFVKDLRSTGSGTLTVASIAGASTVTIDEGADIDIIGGVENGSDYVRFTCNNSFLTGGSIEIADADTIIEGEFPFAMRDAAADFSETHNTA